MPTTSRATAGWSPPPAATVHIHRLAEPEYEHEPFDDGWELTLGSLVVRALHTPGHRPEHTAFALTATDRSDQPWAVLTGDSLFVGDIARPDLAVEETEGARDIFRSLHDTLLHLPEACEVWPGHLGGSLCGGPGMDLKIASTIGFERARQPLLQIGDEEQFVAATTAALGPQPPNFRAIVALNRGPLAVAGVDAHPLTPRQVEQARADGALIVDVRTELQFDEAHIPDAVSISARRAGFGSKLAWIAEPGRPLVLVGRDDEDALDAAGLAAAVGLRDLGGYLAGGMTSWREERRDVGRIPRMTVRELRARWDADPDAIQLLDVRERDEWDRRSHPRLAARPLPRPPRTAGGTRPGAAGRGDLRLGPARRRGGQPARAPRRARRDPRRRRRRRTLGRLTGSSQESPSFASTMGGDGRPIRLPPRPRRRRRAQHRRRRSRWRCASRASRWRPPRTGGRRSRPRPRSARS